MFIGPGAILTNDRYPRAITSSGDLAGADDWTVSPITCRRLLDRAGAIVVAGVDVGRYATVGAGAVVTRTVTNHALVAGNPAAASAGSARAARGSSTPTATRAGGSPRYAAHTELTCGSCGRTYAYVPDAETLEERTGPAKERPHDPDRPPGLRQEETDAVAEVLASGMVAQGKRWPSSSASGPSSSA